jgi:hypothetical protein
MDERIEELLSYFKEYMLDMDKEASGLLGEAKATYPMLVVNLAANSDHEMGQALKEQLLKIWPAYKEKLLFLQVQGNAENPGFSRMETGEALSVDSVHEMISGLFEESNFFKNYTRLLVFYLLDTTVMSGVVDLDAYLDLMKACSEVFSFPAQSSVLFLALNEKIGNEAQASQIRTDLAQSYFETGKASAIAPCTYLVSNTNTVGSHMPKEHPYFNRIFTDVILLADGPDGYVSSNILHGGLKTVGYTMQAKPVEDISKVAVSSLLKKISELQRLNKTDSSQQFHGADTKNLLRRLGIQENGTFYMLENYLAQATKFLPTQEVVDSFPRRTSDDLDLYSLSARAIEEETFGAWGCYMESIVAKVEEEIVSGFQQEGSFQDVYLKYLKQEFLRSELIYMSKNPEEIRALLDEENYTHSSHTVIDSLKQELALGVFKNAGIKDEIVSTIIKAGKQAQEFMDNWNSMVNTESVLIKEQSLIAFYDQKVQNYVDQNQDRIMKEFRVISDMPSLKAFLFNEIRLLIKSDSIFRAPFEEELIQRVSVKDPAKALNMIAEALNGQNVKIWLASNGASLDAPVQMALLLQDSTELYPA